MRQPVAFRLIKKADGLGGQPRGFTVFLANVGLLVGIHEHPAAGHVADRVDPGIGVVRPGVVAVIALGLEIFIVGRALGIVETVRPRTPQSVIPDKGVEAAFGLSCADDRVRAQAEPGHAFRIDLHVGLAEQPGIHAELTQMIAQCHLSDTERKTVPLRAVRGGVAARVEAHPACAADRRLHIGFTEAHAHFGQPVKIRRVKMRMPRAAQVIEPELVIHDEQDVHVSSQTPGSAPGPGRS
jgi:hypothetical protein